MSKSKLKTCNSGDVTTTDDNRTSGIEKGGMPSLWESSDNRADTPLIEWLRVHDFPSYEVSNTGQVRRCEPGRRTHVGLILKQYVDQDGYMRIGLMGGAGQKKRKLVHHLVAEAFVGPRPSGMTVDHFDDNKANNHATNLNYITRADNIAKAHRTGRYPRGENQPHAKLTEVQVVEIKRMLPTMSNCALARIYGVSDVAIRKIRLGRAWAHVA